MSRTLSTNEFLRVQVDAVLEMDIDPSPEMAAKLGELIQVAYRGASPEEWDEIAGRFQGKFGLDRAEVSTRLGRGARVEPTFAAGGVRPEFESLVRGGWFGRYLEYTVESESPAQYHFGSALACVSAGLSRKPLIGWEARETYPNLYVLLIGPAGARKGSAIERALSIIGPTLDVNSLGNEGSQQGFFTALRSRFEANQTCSDGIIVADEFSVLVSRDNYKAELVKWLTDWWDSRDPWRRALASEGGMIELRNPYVCLLGASNMAWLKSLPPDAISGGFLPRVLTFDAPGKRHRKARPRFSYALRAELTSSLAENCGNPVDRIDFDATSGKYIDDWYEGALCDQEEAAGDDQVASWFARKQAAVLKMAVVWQLADGGPKDIIAVEWLEKARAVADWCDVTVADAYGALGVSNEAAPVDDVVTLLKKHKGRLGRDKIVRSLRNRYTARRVEEALRTLAASRMIVSDSNEVEGAVWVLKEK